MSGKKVSVSLKNQNGESVVYDDIDTIQLPTSAGGIATFILNGTQLQETLELLNKTISLDFSNGNQEIQAEPSVAFSKIIIIKPDNLIPENIRKGVVIAGITGTATN